MPASLLHTPAPPSARCFVYTDISKYSPGMLFQELSCYYTLRFVFEPNFAEFSVSVNYKISVFCYVETVEQQREVRLSFAGVSRMFGFFKGSHEKLKWGNKYVYPLIFKVYWE